MFKNGNRIALAAVALATVAALMGIAPATASVKPANASARVPATIPGRYVLAQTFTPAQLYTWRFPTNSPGGFSCTISQVHLYPSVLALDTTGANGNCAVIQSPGLFPTTSGVVQAEIYLSAIPGQPTQIADWAAMWMYGPNWPTDGEIDAVESSFGVSAVTYHYGSSDPSSPDYNLGYTTYRPLYPTNSSGALVQPLTVTGPNVTPGWNTVDIVFSTQEIRIYYNGHLFTTAKGSYITGQPAYLVFDDVSQSSMNTLGIPGTMLVKNVHIFSRVG